MLRPAEMKKIAVVGIKEERQKVLSILHDLGAVQIEPISKHVQQFLKNSIDGSIGREVSEELLRVRSLRAALPETDVSERRRFSSLQQVLQTSRGIRIDEEVSGLKQKEEELLTGIESLKDNISLVEGISFINEDLSIFNLNTAVSFFAVLPADSYQRLSESLAKNIKNSIVTSYPEDNQFRVIVIVPNEQLESFGSLIQKLDIRMRRIPMLKGRAEEILHALRTEMEQKEKELDEVRKKLRAISSKYYALLASLEEQLAIEARKVEVASNLGYTSDAFVLEGWIPAKRLEELNSTLQALAPRSAQVFIIKAESKPPTLLENPKKIGFFESFIRFYSLPQPDEFDPTLIFALAFPIFFGLMLGDVGYGSVILAISLWIIRRVDKKRGQRTIVPAALRRFARNIFPPSAFKKLALAMLPGSVVGIIFGFLFDEYFGFHLNSYFFPYISSSLHIPLPASGAFLAPESASGLKRLLLISGYIGLLMVSLGLVLGFLNGLLQKEIKHAVGKLGWLFVAWGIALLGLAILHRTNISPSSNPLSAVYIAMVVAGVLMIVFGEGGQAVTELPSIVSHIISYTRLVGILLASVMLAYVIDTVFLGAASGGPALLIGGIVILVFGQLFNLILALFEPGIQGARLIYVEFFSKFFHGNGRLFQPFGGKRLYTLSEIPTASFHAKEKERRKA